MTLFWQCPPLSLTAPTFLKFNMSKTELLISHCKFLYLQSSPSQWREAPSFQFLKSKTLKSPLTPFFTPHFWSVRQSYRLHLQTISRIWPLLTTSSAPKGHQCYKTCLDNASSLISLPQPSLLAGCFSSQRCLLKMQVRSDLSCSELFSGSLFSLSIKVKVLRTANMIWPPNDYYLSTFIPYCSPWFSLPQPLEGMLPSESLCKELSSSRCPRSESHCVHFQVFAHLSLTQ